MSTKTIISNQALAHVGSTLISDYSVDTSTPAQLCQLFFDDCVEEMLEDFAWTFATKRVTLDAAAQDAPDFGYDNAYPLPADFLLAVETDPTDADWRIEGDNLVTDESSIGLVYIYSFNDTSKYRAKFRYALALLLASKLAFPITKQVKLVEQLRSLYEIEAARAQSTDSQQESRRTEPLDKLTNVRY